MADKERLVGPVEHGFLHFLGDGAQGRLAATHLGDGDEAALVIDMQDGLDAEDGADHRRRRADAAAATEELQIFHREPVADVQFQILGIVAQGLQIHALALFLRQQVDEKALPQRGAEGIDRVDLAAGVLLHHLAAHVGAHLTGGAEGGGKADVEHIAPGLHLWLHGGDEHVGVGCRGLGDFAGAQAGVELLVGNAARVRGVEVFLPAQSQRKRHDLDAQLRRDVIWQIARGIGDDDVVGHVCPLRKPAARRYL